MLQEYGTVREAFQAYVEAGPQEIEKEVGGVVALVDERAYMPESLAAAMLGNDETMPESMCRELGLPQGSTFGEGATAFLGKGGSSIE